MDIWLEIIRENNHYKAAHPATPDEIDSAEKQLGLTFAADYRAFLASVGTCVCFGHEIKGLSDNADMNVVAATEAAREYLDMIPHSWYVIEKANLSNVVILQDRNGSVYQMAPDMSPSKIAPGLESYLTVLKGNAGIKVKGFELEDTVIKDKAQEALDQKYEEARKKLDNPDQVEKILQQMEKILDKIPGIGDWLADVPAVISLIRSYIRKEYRDVPVGSIIAALEAILYVVSPVDVIPDIIPVVGMMDDAAVFVVCWKMIHDDVDAYQEWRKKTGKDIYASQ